LRVTLQGGFFGRREEVHAMNIGIDSAKELSAHLKALRKTHKLTQAQLGQRLGVKQTRMADIEKNPGVVSVAQLLEVLHALDARLLLVPPPVPPLSARRLPGAPPSPSSPSSPLSGADW
jgi:HTH-type transcriptional regulator/antitoxin HipB